MTQRMSKFDILKQEMGKFTAEDYLTTKPFEFLKQFADNNVIKYIQFLGPMLKDAEAKKVDPQRAQAYSDLVQCTIRPEWAHNFLQYIVKTGQNTPDDNKVHVFPLMCGTGKSSAISHMMSQRIDHHLKVKKAETPDEGLQMQDYGILIVTDSVERAADYLYPGKQAYNALPLMWNPDLVTLMTHENLDESRVSMKRNPVLIMTTQRYFMLSTEELEDYLTWDYGRRNLIVFDEEPMLLQYVALSNTSLSGVTGQLADVILVYKEKDHEDKNWCIEQWKNVVDRLSGQLQELERHRWQTDTHYPNAHCYYMFQEEARYFTEDDDRFWSFINRYKALLSSCYWTICAAAQMIQDGAIYCCTRLRSRYENVFGVVLDHRSKVTDAAAKAIVFDGTGDITPDYLDERFVIARDFSAEFRRDLSNMRVTFIDQNTSKTHMRQDGDRAELNGIVDQLLKLFNGQDGVAFTYQSMEQALRRIIEERGLAGQMLIQHFGAIRGSNAYRDKSHIAQIGLFCRTPLEYLCRALALDPVRLAELKALPWDEGNLWVRKYKEEDAKFLANQTSMLLADTEQNLFRGKIRDFHCADDYNYYVFCSKSQNEGLFEAMQNRYPEVTIEWKRKSLKQRLDKIRNSKRDSAAKKILAFYDAIPSGAMFTARILQDEIGIRQEQLKEARKNPDLDELFRQIRVDGTQQYRKP